MNSVSKLKCERIDSKSVLKALRHSHYVSSFTLCVRMCLPTLSCSFVNCFIEVGIVVRIGLWLLTELFMIYDLMSSCRMLHQA